MYMLFANPYFIIYVGQNHMSASSHRNSRGLPLVPSHSQVYGIHPLDRDDDLDYHTGAQRKSMQATGNFIHSRRPWETPPCWMSMFICVSCDCRCLVEIAPYHVTNVDQDLADVAWIVPRPTTPALSRGGTSDVRRVLNYMPLSR